MPWQLFCKGGSVGGRAAVALQSQLWIGKSLVLMPWRL